MQLIKLYDVTCVVPGTRWCWLPFCAEIPRFSTSARNCFVTFLRISFLLRGLRSLSKAALPQLVCSADICHVWIFAMLWERCTFTHTDQFVSHWVPVKRDVSRTNRHCLFIWDHSHDLFMFDKDGNVRSARRVAEYMRLRNLMIVTEQ